MSKAIHTLIAVFCFLAAIIIAKPSFSAEPKFGWAVGEKTGDKITSIVNTGEKGGLLVIKCNLQTRKLEMNYLLDMQHYDLFVFRNFGAIDVSGDGMFMVGGNSVSQANVYFNVMNADKSFAIARFPVGSKAAFSKAVLTKTIPDIKQQGDEQFLAGDNIKKLLGALSISCPFTGADETPIF